MKKAFTSEVGFTLIELLVVISIIGVLLALSVFGLQGARVSSRDAARKADLELIRSGLEIYKSDCGGYPQALTFGSALVGNGTTCSASNTYISKIPPDALPDRNYSYSSDGTKYYLCAALEQEPNPASPNLPSCVSCGLACNYVVTNP